MEVDACSIIDVVPDVEMREEQLPAKEDLDYRETLTDPRGFFADTKSAVSSLG